MEQAAEQQTQQGFTATTVIPPLRDDLELLPASRNWSGEPRWTIHDPLRNRFIQVSEFDFRLLSAWHFRMAGAVIDSASKTAACEYTLEDLYDLYEFLMKEELLGVEGTGLYQRFSRLAEMRHQSWWQVLLHNYVFFKVPLIHPDRFLSKLYVYARFFVQPWFVFFSLAVGATGLVFIIRNWSQFIHEFSFLFSLKGALVFALTLSIVKIMHEMGHGLMSKHYGVKVPVMGVAFIVMWPILYTDATDSWRLTSRRKRAMIAGAGVMTEMLLACYAMFLWVVLPDGIARSVAFAVATTSWVTSALVNLNPLMRFDGYYLWSDIFNVPNLQFRSLSIFKRYLRGWLFGIRDEAMEDIPEKREYGLVAYAIALLHYRFFLYLGIAILVYHYAFKALGIVLFSIEASVFLAGPVWREVKMWPPYIKAMSAKRKVAWLVIGLGFLFLVCFPWRSDMALPAVLSAQQQYQAFTSQPAQIKDVRVANGDKVHKGQLLISLDSPDLDQKLKVVQAQVKELSARRSQAGINAGQSQNLLVIEQQLVQVRTRYKSLQQEIDELQIRAPFDGVVHDLDQSLRHGMWINLKRPLLLLTATDKTLMAWVTEKQMALLDNSETGYFYAESPDGYQHLPMKVTRISHAATASLKSPYQASVFGGEVAVQKPNFQTPRQKPQLIPAKAYFELEAVPMEQTSVAWQAQQRGVLQVEGKRQSLVVAAFRWLAGAFIRQSGF